LKLSLRVTHDDKRLARPTVFFALGQRVSRRIGSAFSRRCEQSARRLSSNRLFETALSEGVISHWRWWFSAKIPTFCDPAS
jgi:hypothetical protein